MVRLPSAARVPLSAKVSLEAVARVALPVPSSCTLPFVPRASVLLVRLRLPVILKSPSVPKVAVEPSIVTVPAAVNLSLLPRRMVPPGFTVTVVVSIVPSFPI